MGELKFLDFRLRPAVGHYRDMFPPSWVESMHKRFGLGNPSASYIDGSIGKLIEEMDEANIFLGVIMGRSNLATSVPNDEVAQLQKDNAARFIGFAGIDPMGVMHKPLDEMERSVSQLGLKGFYLDQCWTIGNFRNHTGLYPDDGRLYKIYDKCVELELPVALFSGALAGEDYGYTDPNYILHVARDFPKLKIIVTHGGYPHVTTILAAAFRCPNIFVSPDIFIFAPGAGPYIEAINSEALGDQMIFATAYPLAPLKGIIDKTKELKISEKALEKYAFGNAARLLGIGV